MRRILFSLVLISTIVGAGVFASRAFFSDTETSTGNTFVAGKVDLKVDSTAHYAGMVCVLNDDPPYIWQDEDGNTENNPRPELLGQACDGTWDSKDLTEEKFFNFTDVKPGDSGENTISLTVDNNPAWACLNISDLQNNENDRIDPEVEAGDVTNDPQGGELAQNLYFTSWLDQGNIVGWQCPVGQEKCTADPGEGDNIWQGAQTEPLLFTNQSGPASDVLGGKTYALADSNTGPGPLSGNQTNYLGIQWCAGQMTIVADVIQCNGATMGNDTQTDSLTADVSIYAVQSRNNDDFVCSNAVFPTPTPTPTQPE